MDSIPPREFMDIFDRFSLLIDLKECRTQEDIENRFKEAYRMMERGANNAKKRSTRIKWFGRMKFLRIIMRDGTKPTTNLTTQRKYDLMLSNRRKSFASQVIDEAREHPSGLINQTLEHGYEQAKQKKIDNIAKRLGVMTIHKRALHSRKKRRT